MIATSIGLVFVELRLPGRPVSIAGVILHDAVNQTLLIKLRENWDGIAKPEDQEVLSLYEDALRKLANELGREDFMDHLGSSFTHTISVTPEYRINRPSGDLEQYAALLVEKLQFDL